MKDKSYLVRKNTCQNRKQIFQYYSVQEQKKFLKNKIVVDFSKTALYNEKKGDKNEKIIIHIMFYFSPINGPKIGFNGTNNDL